MTFEKALTIFIVALIVFIVLMIFSTWPHKIGYLLLLVFHMPNEFEKTRGWLEPFFEKHPLLDYVYSDVFLWILLIYGAIGIIETFFRLPFIDPDFTIRWWISMKIDTYRILHDPVYGKKVMGADYIEPELRDQTKKATSKKKSKPQSFEKNKHLQDLMKDLNDMIGLAGVKKEISDIVDLENFQRQREKSGLKRNGVGAGGHLVFAGNPGTGKTTVARKLAEIYKELGVISGGQLVEVDRASLVGQYIGETAIKTQEKIREAMGGVLFIDEAYTLAKESEKDFGHEAIDTLLKAMEDYRGQFIVIVAGYPKEMQKFINANPGLSSRFKKTILFEDYNPEELLEIFKLQCKEDDNILTPEAEEIVLDKFRTIYNNRGYNFGNGRTARGLYGSAIQNMSSRVGKITKPSKEDLQTIIPEDVRGI